MAAEAADLASRDATGAAFGPTTPTQAHPRPTPGHSPAEQQRAAITDFLPEKQSHGHHCPRRHLQCPCPHTAALPPPLPPPLLPSSSPSLCAPREHATRLAEAWPSHPSCMPRKQAMAGRTAVRIVCERRGGGGKSTVQRQQDNLAVAALASCKTHAPRTRSQRHLLRKEKINGGQD